MKWGGKECWKLGVSGGWRGGEGTAMDGIERLKCEVVCIYKHDMKDNYERYERMKDER